MTAKLARRLALLPLFASLPAIADEIGCVTTTWKMVGANDRICVYAFDDPRVAGVTCHISQARTGGVKGSFGLAEDPSQFSLACRQVGPITLPAKLPRDETVFSDSTSLIFKDTKVARLFDEKRNVLVYVAVSRRVIEGVPANALSTVPVAPWEAR
ncbi:MAG: hypothetical protein FIB06_02600 [Betaproteobacteria bacterium]|nr:hypothetical protein [Betaproteobacteria bacterium]